MTTQQKQQTEKIKTLKKFAGIWHNQHNSEMKLEVDSDGCVNGTFKTGVDGIIKEDREFPLTGFVSDDVIAFCVNFKEHCSVTAWVGQLVNADEKSETGTIQTMWHMTVEVGNMAEQVLWRSIFSGADTFIRGARSSKICPTKVQASHPLWLEIQSEREQFNCRNIKG